MNWGKFGRNILDILAAGFPLLTCGSIASAQRHELSGTIELIHPELCDDMRRPHVVNGMFPSCGRLRLVRFSYINFRGETQNDGSAIVLDAVANEVLMLFDDLRLAHFPIEKAMLMTAYDGNDDLSMKDNNTSSFNDRNIAGSSRISMHAFGAAIDINPKNNPFLLRSGKRQIVKPMSGSAYLDRSVNSPGMAEQVRAIFADHGFVIWGGDWRNPVDYQHFQLSRDLAEKLVALPENEAREYFESYVQTYRKCIGEADEPHRASAARCRGKP
jgi:hypothetical protein